ncbi:hypothetical protein V5799_034011 [Amblyomma americanum]|uniref:Ran gtpase-activating protein n=1 Tax=Amblyomma americanum TaxID=6943 RepID=A0AAQ4DLP3_AMBAM
MRGSINSPKYLFAALEVNSTLRSLRIGFTFIDPSCGEALALAVSKNTSLLHLELAAHVDNHCMISMAEALSQNTTLEKLRFSGAVEGLDGVLALCDALRTNKTLKRLEFPEFRASRIERAALAEKLNYVRGYSRVVLPLAEPDLPPLSTFLACPTSCPEELGEINFSGVSHVNVKPFLNALASNSRVRTLSVVADATSEAKLVALCRMLRANHSIWTFKITLNSVQEHSVQELLNILEANETIRELEITSFELGAQIASSLSDFFARNRTITKFKLSVIGLGLSWFIEKLSQGIVMNPVILEFQTDEVSTDVNTRYLISERLIRNRLVLNRAVDFVVLHCKDRRCAEAFELFSGKHCLLAQVIETSGKTEPEALRATAFAENFLLDNYLVITGIVRHSVACHPGDGHTQCDRLNADCWRAIVRHLKISDVLA